MLSVKGYPSHLLHRSFTFTSGFTKCIRSRVFFRTVTDSILHFVNLFPHGYGDTRYRIGIFFCTVVVPIAVFLSGFLNEYKMCALFFKLFGPVSSLK